MRTRGLRLHDRKNVRVERFDGCDRIARANFDSAIGDRVDPVSARFGNRRLGKIKHIADDNDLANWFNVTWLE